MTTKVSAFEIFQFSVAPKYALQNGLVSEYVLCDYNNHTESQLDWDLQWLSLFGFNASLGWEKIFIESDCMWAIPKNSGTLYDSDWLNTSDLGMKTNYSESSNSVSYLGRLDLKLGLNIKTWDFLHVLPYAGISYSRINFTGNGGTYWYGNKSYTGLSYDVSYDSPYAVSGSLEGDVISYQSEIFSYNLGVKVKYNFLKRFTASLDFCMDIFTQANAIDNHLKKDRDYLDKMQGFFRAIKIGSELDVKIWKGLSAGLGFNYKYLFLVKGQDYTKSSSDSTYTRCSDSLYSGYTVSGGTSGWYYSMEIFARYSF